MNQDELNTLRPDLRTVAQRPTAPERRPTPIENYDRDQGRVLTQPATRQERRLPLCDTGCESFDHTTACTIRSSGSVSVDDQKQHNDAGKLPMSKLPWGPLKQVVQVLVYGHKKYGSWTGWHDIDNGEERVFESAMRHAVQYASGERLDSESGLPHLAHMATDVLFALWFSGYRR